MTDTVIIGAGHNALAAAFYLARAGHRPLVLERRNEAGGGCVTAEIHPGFRCPRLSHEVWLESRIVRDMDLERHVEFLRPPTRAWSPTDGPPLALFDDRARTAAALRARNTKDADAFVEFGGVLERLAGVIGSTFDFPPPDIDVPAARDLWNLAGTGRRFRALDRRERHRLLRWSTMPVADLMNEWFRDEALKALLAGPGLSGTMAGPRSAGSSLVMLLREASRIRAGGEGLRVRGGPGSLTGAMSRAAAEAGAEIRTGVTVEQVLVDDGRVAGLVADGKQVNCHRVISSLDPRTTLLSLVDASALGPELLQRARNYRASGTLAKINLALSTMPSFVNATGPELLSGRIHVGPDLDYLERAFDHVKYGELSARPWLDITIPSILDTELAPRHAHVASIYAHYAPFRLRGSDWGMAKDMLLSRTLDVIEAYAPDVRSQVVAAEVITPAQLETEWGLSGGHVFHGELALDQLFTMRPLLGHARYEGPIDGLYLCGAGCHPGGFMTGTSGRLAAHAVLRSRRRE